MRLNVYAIGAAALLGIGSALGYHWYIGQTAVWQAERATLVEARKQADQTAKAAEKGVQVEQRRVAQLERHVARLERRRIPTSVITDTVTVPDTCRAVVAPLIEQLVVRDSLLELKDAHLASYDRQNVYLGQQFVAARARLAELEHQVKKPTPKWYVPKVGAGIGCGIAAGGGFNCVAGPTLSWSF